MHHLDLSDNRLKLCDEMTVQTLAPLWPQLTGPRVLNLRGNNLGFGFGLGLGEEEEEEPLQAALRGCIVMHDFGAVGWNGQRLGWW